jgi:hypothetical protein
MTKEPEGIGSVLAQIEAMIESAPPGAEKDRLRANFTQVVRQLNDCAQLVVKAESDLRSELERQLAERFTDGNC